MNWERMRTNALEQATLIQKSTGGDGKFHAKPEGSFWPDDESWKAGTTRQKQQSHDQFNEHLVKEAISGADTNKQASLHPTGDDDELDEEEVILLRPLSAQRAENKTLTTTPKQSLDFGTKRSLEAPATESPSKKKSEEHMDRDLRVSSVMDYDQSQFGNNLNQPDSTNMADQGSVFNTTEDDRSSHGQDSNTESILPITSQQVLAPLDNFESQSNQQEQYWHESSPTSTNNYATNGFLGDIHAYDNGTAAYSESDVDDEELARRLQEEEINAARARGSALSTAAVNDDEELARQLYEQEMEEAERQRRKQLEEDERAALELHRSLVEERESSFSPKWPPVASREAASDDMLRLKETLELLELDEMKRRREEDDERLARMIHEEEERIRRQTTPDEDAEYAARLYADELGQQESRRLAKELQEDATLFDYTSEEDAISAAQLDLDAASAREMAYMLEQPFGEELMHLKDLHPDLSVQELRIALERSDYDVEQANNLLSSFPRVGKASSAPTTRGVKPYTSPHEAAAQTYPIQILSERLSRRYGEKIPFNAIRQACEDATGVESEAERILTNRFPKEVIEIGIHAKSSLAFRDRGSAAVNESMGQRVTVTKAGGVPLNYSSSTHKVKVDEVDEHYRALAAREYTPDDLIEACQRFGGGFAKLTKDRTSTLEQDVVYRALREQINSLYEELRQTLRDKAKANMQGRFDEANQCQDRYDKVKRLIMALTLEASDSLFVQKNPMFVERLFGGARTSSSDDVVVIDLHMLQQSEAERVTLAVLAIARTKRWRTVKIITGKGLHSKRAGESPVRATVEQLLRNSAAVQSFVDQPGVYVAKIRLPQQF